MGWSLVGEPTRWETGGQDIYRARYRSTAAVGDGGEYAVDCWEASSPGEGGREGGRDQHWGKGFLEGGGPALTLSPRVYPQHL